MLKILGTTWAAVARVLLLPLYFLSGFMPRRSDLWVFGSWGGQRYADNAAAFFEYCRGELDGRIELVWISRRPSIVRDLRSQGARACLAWSPRGMFYCLRAGLHVFDCFAKDTNFWLSRGAVRVNLWSGVPLKTFERDIDNPRNRYYRLFHGYWFERLFLSAMMPWHVVRPDLIIATSAEHRDIICRAFDVPAGRVAITGYPRNHCLLERPEPGALPPGFASSLAAGRKLCIYLPTFRDSGRSFIDFDWSRLDEALARNNATLFVKFHPLDATQLPGSFAHIRTLGREVDVYRLLAHSTVLISDYSSIIWDFMLLRRPIVYFVPDLEAFKTHSRAMNFAIEDIAIGPVCRDFNALLAAMDEVLQPGRPGWAESTRGQRMLERVHAYTDGQDSARVLAAIEAVVPDLRVRATGDGLYPA